MGSENNPAPAGIAQPCHSTLAKRTQSRKTYKVTNFAYDSSGALSQVGTSQFLWTFEAFMALIPKDIADQLAGAGESVLAIAVLVGLGAWGGFWLDGKLNTAPWLAIVLSLLGMCLGLWRMVAKALAADKSSK
ncbi:MAG: AtpZ/AtpI family protein [Candidatus Obscuribacterales bacterium]